MARRRIETNEAVSGAVAGSSEAGAKASQDITLIEHEARMIKLVYCFTRKPHMSQADFSRYWGEVHGPIGLRIPGVRRLVQSVALHDSRDTQPPSFDGMAELWF